MKARQNLDKFVKNISRIEKYLENDPFSVIIQALSVKLDPFIQLIKTQPIRYESRQRNRNRPVRDSILILYRTCLPFSRPSDWNQIHVVAHRSAPPLHLIACLIACQFTFTQLNLTTHLEIGKGPLRMKREAIFNFKAFSNHLKNLSLLQRPYLFGVSTSSLHYSSIQQTMNSQEGPKHPQNPTMDEMEKTEKSLAQLGLDKKPKQRKSQTDEQFLQQKEQFAATGPCINKEGWLFNSKTLLVLDNLKKLDRVHMLHVCEKAYFDRDYHGCLEYIKQAEKLFGVALDNESDNEDIKQAFSSAGRKTKKSSKVERHVVELLHIKESCLKRMEAETRSSLKVNGV